MVVGLDENRILILKPMSMLGKASWRFDPHMIGFGHLSRHGSMRTAGPTRPNRTASASTSADNEELLLENRANIRMLPAGSQPRMG
jgi:hypothetical protein